MIAETIQADPTSFEGLKRLAKDFIDAVPGAPAESRREGWKCFSLAYLQFDGTALERHQAALLLQIVGRVYQDHGGAP